MALQLEMCERVDIILYVMRLHFGSCIATQKENVPFTPIGRMYRHYIKEQIAEYFLNYSEITRSFECSEFAFST